MINLSGEIVSLTLGSKQFCEESLPGNLTDEAYLIRISSNDDDLYEKLFLNKNG